LELAEVTRCHLARGREEVLVRWIGQVVADAPWVALMSSHKTYTAFQLDEKLILQVERDFMYGKPYQRHHKQQVEGDNARMQGANGSQAELSMAESRRNNILWFPYPLELLVSLVKKIAFCFLINL
jgi:hypothetical protein